MFKKIFWPGSLASGDSSRDVCTLPFPEASSILPATLQGEKTVKKTYIYVFFKRHLYKNSVYWLCSSSEVIGLYIYGVWEGDKLLYTVHLVVSLYNYHLNHFVMFPHKAP